MKLIEDVYEIDHSETRIIVTVRFSYIPKKNSNIITSIRKYFIDTLPKETQKAIKYDRKILYVLNYSYLRHPITINLPKTKEKLLLANRAVGMTVIYSYLGLQKDLKRTTVVVKKLINSMRKKPFNYVKAIESGKINVGFEI